MRFVILFVLVAMSTVSFAWTNDAAGEMMDARYDLAACNVDYAKEWLTMREGCGDEENVTVFDSSGYVDDLNDDMDDLRDAVDEVDQFEFGLEMIQLGGDSLRLIGAVIADALDHKTLGFFACVREGEEPLMEERDICKAAAMDKEKVASINYVNNELEYGRDQIDELDELGADTSGMEDVISNGEELLEDIEPAFDSGETSEIRKLHLRHSRLVLLFRMEKMLATIDYARPMIEASSNGNREEILEEMDELEADIEETVSDCEYSADVGDRGDYGRQNLECWDDSIDLFGDFNHIQVLILGGIFS